jgi:ABC-type transporter Mla subunit MlaD
MPTVLTVALVALVVALVWLVVELVLTVRKARPCVDAFKKAADDLGPVIASAGEAVEQAKPVIANLDAVLAQAQPAVVQVEPVLRETAGAISALSSDLERLDSILGDVSRATNMAGNAATAVNDAAGSIAHRAKNVFARKHAPQAGLTAACEAPQDVDAAVSQPVEAADEPLDAAPQVEVARKEAGYFTYPEQD